MSCTAAVGEGPPELHIIGNDGINEPNAPEKQCGMPGASAAVVIMKLVMSRCSSRDWASANP
jgi:hypothetical protein